MRVVVIRHSIRNRGGDRLILDYLSSLIKKGHEIVYWTNEVNTHFAIEPKIQIQKIPVPGILGTILFAMFEKFNTDILIVDLVVMAFFSSIFHQRKILYLAQDDDMSYHKNFFIKSFVDFCYKRVLANGKVKTICVSQGLADQFSKYHPRHLTIISNGVDLNFFYRDSASKFSIEKTKPFTILLFARGDYRKGLDIGKKSIELLTRLRPQQDWEVWTIGPEKIELPGITVKNFGLLKNDGDIRAILSAAEIYLVPSRSEGLSLLLLQALACQCAVITTTASSIIRNEVNGLVSPIEDWESLANNLNRILSDLNLKQKLTSNARLLAEEYSLEKSCEEFEKALFL